MEQSYVVMSKMKLNIRSSTGKDLQNLLKQEYESNYVFRLGYRTPDYFIPFLSTWQRDCIRKGLRELSPKLPMTQQRIKGFREMYDIGFVSKSYLVLGKLEEENLVNALVFSHCNYGIHFIESYIQIELYGEVQDLSALFAPIKLIYGFFQPIITLMREPKNLLNMREECLPQLLQDEKVSLGGNLLIMPAPKRSWTLLVIEGQQAYLISHTQTFKIHASIECSMIKTVLRGDWYMDNFTVYDSLWVDGKDVREKSLLYRLRAAKRVSVNIGFCTLTPYYSASPERAQSIIEQHGGLICTNPKTGYADKSSFMYKDSHCVGLVFNFDREWINSFELFNLYTGDKHVFKGTREYPYSSPVPLSQDDRDFINRFPLESTFLFYWNNGGFSPYYYVTPTDLDIVHTSPMARNENEKAWVYLHKGLSRKDVLRLFKNTNLTPKALMIANKTNSLKMLPVNKSVVFYSPIEGEDVLVRTGTIGEGSCLFHALLHAYSKDYATMGRKGRMKFVIRLRASMAGGVDRESWEDMGEGVISKVPYQENVLEILSNLYKFLEGKGRVRGRSTRRVLKKLFKDAKEPDELYKLIVDLLPFKKLSNECLPQAYDRTQDERIRQCSEAVQEDVIAYLKTRKELGSISKEKVEYIMGKVNKMLHTVLLEAENSAFRSYVKGLERVSEDVDSYTIDFISERFNRDVYFLDGTSRLPYNTCPTTNNLKNRKSMIVLWVGRNHYEIVGRLLPGNRIQREFPPDDILISRIRTLITRPEDIPKLYPDLVEYLPRSLRPKSPRRRAKDETRYDTKEESEDSDTYYDSSDHDSDQESEGESP